MILTSTVFDWSTRVTDRRTDRQTDGFAIAYSALSMLSRAKKANSADTNDAADLIGTRCYAVDHPLRRPRWKKLTWGSWTTSLQSHRTSPCQHATSSAVYWLLNLSVDLPLIRSTTPTSSLMDTCRLHWTPPRVTRRLSFLYQLSTRPGSVCF